LLKPLRVGVDAGRGGALCGEPIIGDQADGAGPRDGSVAPARYGGHRRPVLAPHEDVLRALVAAQPDITLAEI
jgi:hypothetical protein